MGYTTEFWGEASVSPPLNAAEVEYLNKFAGTRRMRRHSGAYTVEDNLPALDPTDSWGDYLGQRHTVDVIDYNNPPQGQPGLWCQWEVDSDGAFIRWNGSEKFYHATEWMEYIICHFLRDGAYAGESRDPQFADFTFDHVVNGIIEAQGEDPDDRWRIEIFDNSVKTYSMR